MIYDGLLGRAPDPLGLEGWASALQSGGTVHDAAAGFLSSPEFTARYGSYLQISAHDFIEDVYSTALRRLADPQGLQAWENFLATGGTREDLANGIVFSPEHVAYQQSAFNTGIFVPNPTDSAIARLYYALLDRSPDAGGLQAWENAVSQGVSLQGVAQGFMSSAEYQAHGQQTNQQFVDALYQNVFGAPDAAGEQSWTNSLALGTPRATLAVNFVASSDVAQHLSSNIEVGFRLA